MSRVTGYGCGDDWMQELGSTASGDAIAPTGVCEATSAQSYSQDCRDEITNVCIVCIMIYVVSAHLRSSLEHLLCTSFLTSLRRLNLSLQPKRLLITRV